MLDSRRKAVDASLFLVLPSAEIEILSPSLGFVRPLKCDGTAGATNGALAESIILPLPRPLFRVGASEAFTPFGIEAHAFRTGDYWNGRKMMTSTAVVIFCHS